MRKGRKMSEQGNKPLLNVMEKCGHFLYHRRGGRRGQGRILQILMTEGEITQKALQARLGIQSGSMSEIVQKLEANSLICRQKDEKDRRQIKLKMTAQGEAFFKQHLRVNLEEERHLFDQLTKEEQAHLLILLEKLFLSWETHFDKSLFEHKSECNEDKI